MDLLRLSDEALLGKVEALAETERFSLVDLIIHLGELDLRSACQNRGYPSVFAYLTRHLGYSECDAMRRVRTARAARRYPSILRLLAQGELHLVSVSLIAPFLTPANHQSMLRKVARRSKREVERMVAQLSQAAPEPRDRIRPLPAPASPPEAAQTERTGQAEGLELVLAPGTVETAAPAPRRVLFTFTADEDVQSWFEQARDLLRHRFPMGRMEEIIGEALRRLVQDEFPSAPQRARRESSPDSRHIPKWVQDEVWRRDCGRCAFVGPDGIRCGETAWLEFDHVVPFALGGPSNAPANVRLLCRSHNQSERERLFGAR